MNQTISMEKTVTKNEERKQFELQLARHLEQQPESTLNIHRWMRRLEVASAVISRRCLPCGAGYLVRMEKRRSEGGPHRVVRLRVQRRPDLDLPRAECHHPAGIPCRFVSGKTANVRHRQRRGLERMGVYSACPDRRRFLGDLYLRRGDSQHGVDRRTRDHRRRHHGRRGLPSPSSSPWRTA